MQNVLFFIFRLHGGGAERVVSNLSIAFSDRYNIKIAVFDNLEKTYDFKGELIRIKLPFSKDPITNPWWARIIRLVVLIYKLRKLKREYQIDVAISFAEQANIVNVLSRRKEKVILSVRTLLSKEIAHTPKMKILQSFIRLLYNRASHVIVPSKVASLDISRSFGIKPDQIKVIYNYIDKERIAAMAVQAIDDEFHRQLFDQPVLLNVGRITPAKGQWLLLEVLKKLKQRSPGYKLVIIGEAETEGNLKWRLIELASKLGLSIYDNTSSLPLSLEYDIYLLGFQVNPFKYMAKSRLLVFPSVFEGFPNTVLEAMQCDLPVIVADCQSGPREILAPELDLDQSAERALFTQYGVLAPALPTADIEQPIANTLINEWVYAITELISNEELRTKYIRSGRGRVKDFDREFILEQWNTSIIRESFPA